MLIAAIKLTSLVCDRTPYDNDRRWTDRSGGLQAGFSVNADQSSWSRQPSVNTEPHRHPSDLSADPGATEPGPHDPLVVRKAALTTAAIGIVHSLLLIAGALVLKTQTPGINASDDDLVAFFEDPNKRRLVVLAGIYLIPFAGIAFIWFFVALRAWISASAPRLNVILSNVQLVSGIIYTTLVLAAAGACP